MNTRVISPVTALNPSTLEGSTLASCLMRLPRLHQQHRPCSSATLAAQLHLIINPSQTSLRITVNVTRSQREQEKRNKIQQCFRIKIRRSNSAPSHSIKAHKDSTSKLKEATRFRLSIARSRCFPKTPRNRLQTRETKYKRSQLPGRKTACALSGRDSLPS